jgi:hypothetical protein
MNPIESAAPIDGAGLAEPCDPNEAEMLGWISPLHRAAPAEALARIRSICAQMPDLYAATVTVLATHQGVPREMLAAALKQARRDADALSRDDVVSLLNASWNGGREGFNAVLRTRRGEGNRPRGLPSWIKPDD